MDENTTSYKPSWLALKEFKFIVGTEEREFLVHSALVARQSKPLRSLITNGMKESQEGVIKWPHTDSETFERFVEFLYYHDFFIDLRLNPGYEGVTDSGVDDDEVIQNAWRRFCTRERYVSYNMITLYKPCDQLNYMKNLADAYTTITKVHILAHYYDIAHLMDICRSKLHSIMLAYPGAEEICPTLRMCMAEPGAAGLQELVLEYCALSLRWLLVYPDFQSLTAEFPGAAIKIMKKLKSFTKAYFKQAQ